MYFMFVDDSGSARPHRAGRDTDGNVHILCGMIVHERAYYAARAAIDGAKRDLFPDLDPDDWELHAYEAWNDRGGFSGREGGQSLSLAKKKEVFSKAVDGIAESGATLVGVVVRKSRLPGGLEARQIAALSWRLLAERFGAYLDYRGGLDFGLIVSDASDSDTEREIRRVLQGPAVGIGRRKSPRGMVIEDVIFRDSRREPLIQGADTAAYVLQKHCRGDPSFAGWFDALGPCWWRGQDGSIHGFGIKNYPDPR